MLGDILRTHYILIYSTHNGDDTPQKSGITSLSLTYSCGHKTAICTSMWEKQVSMEIYEDDITYTYAHS